MKKKLVIITGAGRGIGKAVSETLASCGYICVLIARNPKEIKNVEKKIKKINGVAFSTTCDITDYSSVQKTIKEIISKHGNIYGLVNCAASSPAVGPSDDLDLKDISAFETKIIEKCKSEKPEILKAISKSGKLEEDTENLLVETIKELKQNFNT